jgi:hypothetical protein
MLVIGCRGLGFTDKEAETVKRLTEQPVRKLLLQGVERVEVLEQFPVAEVLVDALVALEAHRSLPAASVAVELGNEMVVAYPAVRWLHLADCAFLLAHFNDLTVFNEFTFQCVQDFQ